MLLIDILNGLSFAGADFESALSAARQRTRLLNPMLRRILDYAAKQPQAYQYRFSESLLASAAFLLSEARDPAFLSLAAPLIDAPAEPSLLGYLPEDSARLVAAALDSQLHHLPALLRAESWSEEFYTTAFESLVLVAHWSPALRSEVESVLRSFLRPDSLSTFEPEVRQTLVECCCRLDPMDFVLDLQLAIDRGELDRDLTKEAMAEASSRPHDAVWLGGWTETGRLTEKELFLRQYKSVFLADELCLPDDESRPDPVALSLFNSVAAPVRDYRTRFAALQATPEMLEVCSRVVRLAVRWPENFRDRHHYSALSAAICLAAPVGDERFTDHFAALLRLPTEYLDRLLGDDLTDMCESAFAVSARLAPGLIRAIVEDTQVAGVTRAVAIGALMQQVHCGYRPANELAQYCRDLVDRRSEIGKDSWVWTDVVKASARSKADDLLPTLKLMVREGYYVDERGNSWLFEEDIEEEFANPGPDPCWPSEINAMQLLDRSYDDEHRRVREFLGCLRPPQYDPADAIKSADEI